MNPRGPYKQRRARSGRGYALLEILIAVTLMVFGVLSAFYSQLVALDLLRTVREHNTAVADLESCMEQVLTVSSDNIPTAAGFPPGQSIAAFDDLHLENELVVPAYPGFLPGGPVPDPLEVRLTITWDDWRGRPQALQLATVTTR